MVKKAGVSSNWNYYTYKNNYNLLEIEDIIRNTYLNYNIYVSNMFIYEYRRVMIVKFNLWVYRVKDYKFQLILMNYLKSLLVLRYNKNVEFHVKFSRNIFTDDKLLGTFIYKNNKKMNRLLKLLKSRC